MTSSSACKLLVIDDDLEDGMLIGEMLGKSPFSISHSSSFSDARQIAIDQEFDAILVDYFLDGYTALDFITLAKSYSLQSPIIVMTGLGDNTVDKTVMAAGASDFIPKSELSPNFLIRTIFHAIERQQNQRQIKELLNIDRLTGLVNKGFFEVCLAREMSRSSRSLRNFSVLFIDLDRFKDINDTLGHHVGDQLLVMVADRLKKCIREQDIIARIGGDEFTVLVTDMDFLNDAVVVSEKIMTALQQPFLVGPHKLSVGTSIGIATFPDSGTSPSELMQHADIALYEAKRNGKRQYCLFTSDLRSTLDRKLLIEEELKQALLENALEVYYQPQVDMRDGRVIGYEALCRWFHHSLGTISPVEFIPIAEKTGQIVEIGKFVFLHALKFICGVHHSNPEAFIAVNVSPAQFVADDYYSFVLNNLRKFNLEPEKLDIEITENLFLDHDDPKSTQLKKLQSLGVQISIDDFGTGYSSLSYLKNLPASKVKIDKSFIDDIFHCPANQVLIRSIIGIAKGLEMQVMAEGVESKEQADFLLSIGCYFAQGYYFGKPKPQAELKT